MDAWIYCVIILIRRSLCFWEKKGQTQCICIYMCICVCVILQLHHTETMLRCGLPSEKEDGRKVSSDFVWLFFGEHAATIQYGCMWYYNYAMYILQCVIILKKKTTACGFSFNEGGCCWIQKNAGDVWDAGAPRTSRETSLLRMWIIRGVRGRGYVDLTGLPLLPSCLSSAVQCIYYCTVFMVNCMCVRI